MDSIEYNTCHVSLKADLCSINCSDSPLHFECDGNAICISSSLCICGALCKYHTLNDWVIISLRVSGNVSTPS